MTADEFKSIAIKLFGRRGWTSDLAACLKIDRTTVYRYTQGQPIPGPVEAAIRSWLQHFKATGVRPAPPE